MTEVWLPVPGYEGLYEASDGGRVRNAKTGVLLNPYLRGNYPSITLHKDAKRKIRAVHHIILEVFAGPRPDGRAGAHLDGQVTNSRANNLAWVTPSENERHKSAHGSTPRGTKASQAKFTDLQVQIIREAHALGLSVDKIGVLAGVYGSTINDIVRGHSYPQRERAEDPSVLASGFDPLRMNGEDQS